MRDLIKNKPFLIGFFIGISGLVCINVFMFFNTSCHHCYTLVGFPIPFYKAFSGNVYIDPSTNIMSNDDYEIFSALFLVIDVVVTIFSGYLLGLIFKFVTSKAEIEKLNLK